MGETKERHTTQPLPKSEGQYQPANFHIQNRASYCVIPDYRVRIVKLTISPRVSEAVSPIFECGQNHSFK